MEFNRLNEMQVNGCQDRIRRDAMTCRDGQKAEKSASAPNRAIRLRVAALMFVVIVVAILTVALSQVSYAQAQPAGSAFGLNVGSSIHVAN